MRVSGDELSLRFGGVSKRVDGGHLVIDRDLLGQADQLEPCGVPDLGPGSDPVAKPSA